MRKLILTSVMVLALPAIMVAQRNDIYSSGVKSTVSAPVATAAPAVQSTVTSSPVVSSSFAERDPDEYNRRYNYASSAAAIDNSFANDVIYVHDTVFVENSLSDTKAYREGYLDASEDYEFAIRMLRFHSTTRLLNPRYRWTAVADIFWDPWYDPLYSPAWSYAYLDPWYYDPWYYDPWYYDPWYPHYHGYWPGHSHTIIIAGNVGRPTDRFVPNRQLNNRWDRQLTGSSSGRVVRGATDRDPVRQAVSSRTTSSSTVGRTSTGASRNVRVTAPSSSRTSTTVRQNATTNRTQTSAERTTSVVNRSTSGTQRSAGVSSSSVRSSATVNRTTQAGTTYNRPSSTNRQSTNSAVRSEAGSASSRQSTGSTLRSSSGSSSSSSSRQSTGSTLRSSSSTPSRQPANTISRNSENSSRSSSRGIGASSSSFSSSSSSFSSSSGSYSSGGSSASSSARSSATSRR